MYHIQINGFEQQFNGKKRFIFPFKNDIKSMSGVDIEVNSTVFTSEVIGM